MTCQPDEKRCAGNGVATCNSFGTEETRTACASDESCDADTAKCVPQTCRPGSVDCVSETIATCDDSGSSLQPNGDDCAASQTACWEGACQPVVCTAGFLCVGGNSFECTSNRTQLTLAKACTFDSGQFCNAETGQCQDFVCEPAKPTCNGDLATSCANDGSRALDEGIDCTATNKVCWAAECLPPICEPGSYACDGTDLKLCVHKGTAFEVAKTCGAGTVCDGAAGTCRLQKCVPDQPACDGALATTCDATGLSYTGASQDCSADGDVCVNGACKPVICTPDATYCAENELRKCGANGGSYELLDACLESEFCDADRAVCAPDTCAAGSPVCADNLLTTCKADGSGPAAAGTDCGSQGQICFQAACRTLVCTPNARFCDGTDVALCNAVGTNSAPYDNCGLQEFCDASAPAAAQCSPDLCPQGGNGCSKEQLAACNADGSGFASVGVDCSTSGKVCDLTGACASVALDAVGLGGSAVPWGGSAIHFGLIHVATPRTLVQFDAAVAPRATSPMTWLVYESATKLGTFTQVTQTASPGYVVSGFGSSGAISVALKADNYYLLGVTVKGEHTAMVLDGGSPAPVSFGQSLGGFTYDAGDVPVIPASIRVSAGLLADDVALRLETTTP